MRFAARLYSVKYKTNEENPCLKVFFYNADGRCTSMAIALARRHKISIYCQNCFHCRRNKAIKGCAYNSNVGYNSQFRNL